MSNKRYYWVKLKEDFFKDKAIKKLRKIAGGDTYTIIYLKLMLRSMETEGKLYFDGLEDTFCDELALDIDEDAENVKVTVMYLIKCGLIKEVNEKEMEITRINEMVGSETNKAELMRKKREKDKLLKAQEVTMLPDVTKTLHRDRDRYRDKDIDIEREIKSSLAKNARQDNTEIKTKKTAKRFTPPTIEEVKEYCLERGNNIDPEHFVAFYESKGWKVGANTMKNWKSAVITWEKREKANPQQPKKSSYNLNEYEELTQEDIIAKLYGG